MPDSVLITGAATGLGQETALTLAAGGFNVFASVQNAAQRELLERAAAQRGVTLHILELDVTDLSSIRRAVDMVVAQAGGIFGLVNNAGLGLRGFFEDLSEAEIRQLFDVNVFGAMAVTRAVLPYMRQDRRGRIVLISSVAGRIAGMTYTGYGAGKFAIEGFGEALSLEVRPFGIHVSLVEPGPILTPHFTVNRGRARQASNPSSPYYTWFLQHEHMIDKVIRRRRITPRDVANTVQRALTDERPRLRYPVGRGVKLMLMLRRHLPGELFDRFFAWYTIWRVTRPRRRATALSQLALPDDDALAATEHAHPSNVDLHQ